MTTVLDVVTDAMRDANQIEAAATPDAAEAATVLSLLNRMALAWPAQDLHTGWSTVVLTDEFPLDDRHREGVTAMLVLKIQANRGAAASLDQKTAGERGYSLLSADYKQLENLRVEDGLRIMPSQRWFQ